MAIHKSIRRPYSISSQKYWVDNNKYRETLHKIDELKINGTDKLVHNRTSNNTKSNESQQTTKYQYQNHIK